MSGGRADIMARIRASLGRGALAQADREACDRRLADPPTHPAPAWVEGDAQELRAGFIDRITEQEATADTVADWADVPAAVARYLAGHNAPARARIAPAEALRALDWGGLEVAYGPAAETDAVGIGLGLAGVAETGTLVVASGPDSPATLNFVPETHIVLLPADRIVGPFEAVWRRLREMAPTPPRTINLISGPSRTADIEQTMILGAHGPKRLHVIVIDRP